MSIIQEDRQGFGVLLSKNVNLEIALKYPTTSVPLSLANPDGTLREAPKYLFGNDLIANAKSLENAPPINARWIVDNMAAIRCVKPKDTYRTRIKLFLEFVTPNDSYSPIALEIVSDTYLEKSAKNGTRFKRGEESRRFHLGGAGQDMLKGNEWSDFFHNIGNKEDLIRIITEYLMSDEGRRLFTLPLIITRKELTWRINGDIVENLNGSNHEEADTKMILHALRENTNVVVVARDTDVLVLMVYAYALKDIKENWYMKIGAKKFVNVRKIVKYLGKELSLKLPHIHAITGCDTTSYLYNVGKMRVLNKCLKNNGVVACLERLGENASFAPEHFKDIIRFIQTICYSGKPKESLVDTRVRLYKNQKIKGSVSLPADPDSMKQAILRVHHQLYYWLRLDTEVVDAIPFEGNGWKVIENTSHVLPVWFTGCQLPPQDVIENGQVEEKAPPSKRPCRRNLKKDREVPTNVLENSVENDYSEEMEYIYIGSDDSESESDDSDSDFEI